MKSSFFILECAIFEDEDTEAVHFYQVIYFIYRAIHSLSTGGFFYMYKGFTNCNFVILSNQLNY